MSRWSLALLCLFIALPGVAAQLTVISFGGSVRDAQRQAFYAPYRQASGVLVINGSYNGDLAKLRRMQTMQHVTWDVVEVEAPELARGCESGVFQPLDESLALEGLTPGALRPCGVGSFVWSMVLAYNPAHLREAPRSWADFWDLERFPGGRGLRLGAKYNLEFALLADGVPADRVYATLATAAGVERAFRKLEQIKPHIRWWKAGEEPVRGLRDGSLVMSAAYSGRIGTTQDQGDGLDLVWAGSIYDFDYWAIPKGSINGPEARRFIQFVSQPGPQRAFAESIPYGPVNPEALAALTPERVARLPTAPANLRYALAMDVDFWSEHGALLDQRFEAWRARP